MAGTVIGGKRCAITNKAKYGEGFYREIGSLGGRAGTTGGFYANRDLARIAGQIGGRISRRGKYKTTERERREIHRAYEELLAVHVKAKKERSRQSEIQMPVPRIDEGAVTVFDRKRGLGVVRE